MSPEIDLAELAQNLRRGIIETLQLISSREEQLNYQRNVPIAYVSAELFCLWDGYYNEDSAGEEWFRNVFSNEQLEAMKQFNQIFNDVLTSLPEELPSIEELILTPQWGKLSTAATLALRAFDFTTR